MAARAASFSPAQPIGPPCARRASDRAAGAGQRRYSNPSDARAALDGIGRRRRDGRARRLWRAVDAGAIAADLATGSDPGDPSRAAQRDIALEHIEAMFSHYGGALGIKNARKHIGWYLTSSGADEPVMKSWRKRLCTEWQPSEILAELNEFYDKRGRDSGMTGKMTSTTGLKAMAASAPGLPAADIDSEILLAALPHPILVIGHDGSILFANAAADRSSR